MFQFIYRQVDVLDCSTIDFPGPDLQRYGLPFGPLLYFFIQGCFV